MNRYLIFIPLMMSLVFMGCSKNDDDNNDGKFSSNGGETITISDSKSLNENLTIEGATKKSGDIPAPENSGSYDKSLTILTPQVILTAGGNSFDFQVETESQAKVIYFQLDGADKHHELVINEEGNFVNKRGVRKIQNKIVKCAQPNPPCGNQTDYNINIPNDFEVKGTVQVFAPPTEGGVPDFDFIDEANYWSSPEKAIYQCKGTGTGEIYTTLTWNSIGDVDLWLIEPDGNKIYYAAPNAPSGGELDYDDTEGYGPENIFYNEAPPSGEYQVWVHYFDGLNLDIEWTVSIKNKDQHYTERGVLENVGDSTLVTSFTY